MVILYGSGWMEKWKAAPANTVLASVNEEGWWLAVKSPKAPHTLGGWRPMPITWRVVSM